MAEARLDALLRDTAATATWPATPDVRATVVGRIARDGLRPEASVAAAARAGAAVTGEAAGAAPSLPSTRPARPMRPAVRLGRALALAVIALLVLAGIAAALGFRLPGLDILFVQRLPPAGTGLDLGSQVTLDEALAFDQPTVRVPAALPRPDAAFVIGAADRRIVTLAYRAEPGEPTLPGSDLALTVMAAPGSIDESMLRKLLGPGTTVEHVTVGGLPGWWISGAPHDILVRRPGGDVGLLSPALAGDTLVFARDGTLYRLESSLGRDATIEIADSMP